MQRNLLTDHTSQNKILPEFKVECSFLHTVEFPTSSENGTTSRLMLRTQWKSLTVGSWANSKNQVCWAPPTAMTIAPRLCCFLKQGWCHHLHYRRTVANPAISGLEPREGMLPAPHRISQMMHVLWSHPAGKTCRFIPQREVTIHQVASLTPHRVTNEIWEARLIRQRLPHLWNTKQFLLLWSPHGYKCSS